MNTASWILLILIGIAFALAVVRIVTKGSCECGDACKGKCDCCKGRIPSCCQPPATKR